MLSYKVCILAVVAFTACTSAEFTNIPDETVGFCECIENVPLFQEKYQKYFDRYYEQSQTHLKEAHEDIKKRLKVVEKANNPCKLSLEPDDYIQDLLALCGGSRLGPSYVPIWKNKDASPSNEEVCRFITSALPTIQAREKNMLDIIHNCPYMELFDKTMLSVFEGCGVCKA